MPEKPIDTKDPPDMVNTFDQASQTTPHERTEPARTLREVNRVRDLATHPPENGVSRELTLDQPSVLERAPRQTGDAVNAEPTAGRPAGAEQTEGNPTEESPKIRTTMR